MGSIVQNAVNTGFGWCIVLLAVIGYFLTLKRTGERWFFWVVLAIGWGFFAFSQTLILAGAKIGLPYIGVLLLSSYALVIYSMVLLFIKLIKAR